jgi:hypothetical protein
LARDSPKRSKLLLSLGDSFNDAPSPGVVPAVVPSLASSGHKIVDSESSPLLPLIPTNSSLSNALHEQIKKLDFSHRRRGRPMRTLLLPSPLPSVPHSRYVVQGHRGHNRLLLSWPTSQTTFYSQLKRPEPLVVVAGAPRKGCQHPVKLQLRDGRARPPPSSLSSVNGE